MPTLWLTEPEAGFARYTVRVAGAPDHDAIREFLERDDIVSDCDTSPFLCRDGLGEAKILIQTSDGGIDKGVGVFDFDEGSTRFVSVASSWSDAQGGEALMLAAALLNDTVFSSSEQPYFASAPAGCAPYRQTLLAAGFEPIPLWPSSIHDLVGRCDAPPHDCMFRFSQERLPRLARLIADEIGDDFDRPGGHSSDIHFDLPIVREGLVSDFLSSSSNT